MKNLIDSIVKAGGRPYLVGGAVIDQLAGREEIKDFDIEVFGLNFEQLVAVLQSLNLKADLVGQAFGIIKTRVNGVEIDLSIPRRENKVGVGHRGFSVEVDGSMNIFDAARRRDLTINAMSIDLVTNELVDPFGGQDDLANGCIRLTDVNTFCEDPLRVLRIMQILPRKGKFVDSLTMGICANMVDKFHELPSERVFEEFNKLLLKSQTPSMGLTFLKDCGWLGHFPELHNLVGCQQNPEWHPEGDVWTHTMMVLDNAAKVVKNLPDEWQLAFMYGAMLHDCGKPSTTTADLRSPGHAEAGEALAENFMRRLTTNTDLIKKVCLLVKLHMRPGQLYLAKAGLPAWKRLHNQCRLDILGWHSKCDSAGRTGRSLNDEHGASTFCFDFISTYGVGTIPKMVTGKDLLAWGMLPGKAMGDLLSTLYQMQLDGTDYMDLEHFAKNTIAGNPS